MLDLRLEQQADGRWLLQQGDDSPILLHRVQVRLLAERAGLLAAPDPLLQLRLSARHLERLRTLLKRVRFVLDTFGEGIAVHFGYGGEVNLHLEAIEDLAADLL